MQGQVGCISQEEGVNYHVVRFGWMRRTNRVPCTSKYVLSVLHYLLVQGSFRLVYIIIGGTSRRAKRPLYPVMYERE